GYGVHRQVNPLAPAWIIAPVRPHWAQVFWLDEHFKHWLAKTNDERIGKVRQFIRKQGEPEMGSFCEYIDSVAIPDSCWFFGEEAFAGVCSVDVLIKIDMEVVAKIYHIRTQTATAIKVEH